MDESAGHILKGTKQRPRADPVAAALYATSGNVCGYSDPDTYFGCEEVIYRPGYERVMAEIAHIVGLNPRSCRYRDGLTIEERNSFDNLILLCPSHHRLVDDVQCDRHDEDVMREMKQRQEQAHDPENRPFRGELFDHIVEHIVEHAVAQGVFEPGVGDEAPIDRPDSEDRWGPYRNMSSKLLVRTDVKNRVIVENVGDGQAASVDVTPAEGSEKAFVPSGDVVETSMLMPGSSWVAGHYAPAMSDAGPHAVFLQWFDAASQQYGRGVFQLGA